MSHGNAQDALWPSAGEARHFHKLGNGTNRNAVGCRAFKVIAINTERIIPPKYFFQFGLIGINQITLTSHSN